MSDIDADVRRSGRIVFFLPEKGYGFIVPDNPVPGLEKDLFVHANEVRGNPADLRKDARVTFGIGERQDRTTKRSRIVAVQVEITKQTP